MEEIKRNRHGIDSHSTSSSESFEMPPPITQIDDNSVIVLLTPQYSAIIKSMLKTVYKCLESPSSSVYESGLSTLESIMTMFKEEIKPLSGIIISLLKYKPHKAHAKRIEKIKKTLINQSK